MAALAAKLILLSFETLEFNIVYTIFGICWGLDCVSLLQLK